MVSVSGRARSLVTRHGEPVTLRTSIWQRDPNSDWDEETETVYELNTAAIVAEPGAATPRYNAVTTTAEADRVMFVRDDITVPAGYTTGNIVTGDPFPLRDQSDQREPTEVDISDRTYEVEFLAEMNGGVYRFEVNRQ